MRELRELRRTQDRELCRVLCQVDDQARAFGYDSLGEIRRQVLSGRGDIDEDWFKGLDVLAFDLATNLPEWFTDDERVAAAKIMHYASTMNWPWWKNRTTGSLRKAAQKAVETARKRKARS